MASDPLNVIQNPERLKVLDELGILDSPTEAAFDRLTRLASLIIGVPISYVSILDADRQFFKSQFGLPEPVASERETPLESSFCQYVVADSSPLVVEDARLHPVLKDKGAIEELGAIGYLGMPLTTSKGVDLGSFCVVDNKPRVWTEDEIEIVRELALSVMTEIELRSQIAAREKAEESLKKSNNQYRKMYMFSESTLDHMEDTIRRGADSSEILVYLDQMRDELKRLKD